MTADNPDSRIIAKRNRAASALCGILGIPPVSWARLGVMIGNGKVSLSKLIVDANFVSAFVKTANDNALYSTELVAARQRAAEQEAEIARLNEQYAEAVDELKERRDNFEVSVNRILGLEAEIKRLQALLVDAQAERSAANIKAQLDAAIDGGAE